MVEKVKPLPAEVTDALKALQVAAKKHRISMADVVGVTPNQACMWQMNAEVHRLRALLDQLAPGWNDDI